MSADSPRTIVVTGVSRGLGRALLTRFHAAGHRVAGCARSSEGIAALRKALPGAELAAVDVADAPAVAAWAEDIVARMGPPDLLVNNAALMNRPAPLWEVPAEEFEALLAVNVAGTANVVRAFVPAMIARGTGVIVNLSSGWGRSTSPEVGPYCTTKYAIEGFTSALAQELPKGMAAVALSPGVVDTDMLRLCMGEGAASHQDPETWSRRAASFFLKLGPHDNGRSLAVS
jgi:NAD(P)-dependent dehydrogenase (short-subunit alcohol dehydrogenase family)